VDVANGFILGLEPAELRTRYSSDPSTCRRTERVAHVRCCPYDTRALVARALFRVGVRCSVLGESKSERTSRQMLFHVCVRTPLLRAHVLAYNAARERVQKKAVMTVCKRLSRTRINQGLCEHVRVCTRYNGNEDHE
jgi:hypothetical protein